MSGEQGEAHQQAKQVGQRDPFVAEMAEQPSDANAGFETGKQRFIERNGNQTGQRDLKSMVVQ